MNIERTCRCCLAEGDNMLSINRFLVAECSKTIAEVLMDCIAINPHDDGLPQTICADCMQKAKQWFNFKTMCHDSYVYLRNFSSENCVVVKMENEIEIAPEMVQVQNDDENDFLDENFDDECEAEVEEKEEKEEEEEVVDKDEDMRLVNNAKKINGRFQCELCEKTLADRRTFLLHVRLHLGKNLKHCDICNRGFAKQNHLDRHKATHSKRQNKKNLPKTNILANNTVKTEEKHHKEYSPKYESIITEVLNEEKVSIPMDEEESKLLKAAKEVNGRLQCPICPKTLSQRKILKLHIRSHVGKNLQHCKICNRGFAKGSNLNRHMLLHRKLDMNSDEEDRIIKNAFADGRYSCSYCSKILIDRQTFRLHIRLHISKLFVRCDVCNQAFDDDDKLQEHMTSHGDQFPCTNCDDSFKTYHERTIHLKTMHLNSKTPEDTNPLKTTIKYSANDNDNDDEDKQMVDRSNLVDGRYECEFCKKTLANRTTLKYHIRLHLQKHLLTCDICKQGFSKKSHLKRHMATHIKKKQPCRYCDATFETYEERRSHTVDVHKKIIHNQQSNRTFITCWTQPNGAKQCICMICDMEFEHIHKLDDHMRNHMNNPASFQVDYANKMEMLSKFNNISIASENIAETLHRTLEQNPQQIAKCYRIISHQGWELSLSDSETDNDDDNELNSKTQYECGQCTQSFDRIHKLMCHMKFAHDQRFRDFRCNCCFQCFPNEQILAKHMRQQCENDDKTIICSMCNSKFLWEASLQTHLSVYHETEKKFVDMLNSKPFSCNKCSRSFSTEAQLENHAERHHLPRPKRKCEVCEKLFSRADNLKSHMRTHLPPELRPTVNKKHLCPHCGRSFSNSSNLTVHIRRHTGERPYQCKYCDARFPRSSDLTCHIRIHTKEKTCVCNICGRGFTRSNKLVRHMRVHTGERPYKCSQCDRAFTQSNDLTLHVRRHTGEKPFSCECNERFITNSLLQQHRRATGHIDHHSNNTSTQLPTNSVNNPNRKWHDTDGMRTGITSKYSLIDINSTMFSN